MWNTLRHSFVGSGHTEGLKGLGYPCVVALATLLFAGAAMAQDENVVVTEEVLDVASPVSIEQELPEDTVEAVVEEVETAPDYIVTVVEEVQAVPDAPHNDEEVVTGVKVIGFRAERDGAFMKVDMSLDVSNLHVKRNRAVLLTPCIINPDDSLHLNTTGVYGRRRYFQTLRKLGDGMLCGEGETTYRTKNLPDVVEYHKVMPYEKWMDGANFQLHRYLYGCCERILSAETGWLGKYGVFRPEFLYVTPEAEVKTRSLEGTAYVDFLVNKTDIRPDYHNNEAELGKIRETIGSVQGDEDVTIDNIWLKGYASPESPYKHNEELAIGRVNAIKGYVQKLYNFPDNKITTDYEPENWEGLRRYVEQSSLEHKAEILALIDTDMNPDEKEAQIKKTYPDEYRHLLENCYPYLRRTDYRVNYTVRGYSDVEEIKQILRTEPQKLSLNEMYLVAQTFEPGSGEFNEVFQTAVRLYPNDPIANLNAANAAMKAGDLAAAEHYLAKAGDSAEAEYARGVYAYLTDDYDTAREHLYVAAQAGIDLATQFLDEIQ